MAELTEIEKVLQKGRLTNYPFWRIYTGSGTRQSETVAESSRMPNQIGEGAKEYSHVEQYLKDNLVLLPPGEYCIHFKTHAKEKNDIVVHYFKIDGVSAIGNMRNLPQQQYDTGGITSNTLITLMQQNFQQQMNFMQQVSQITLEKVLLENKLQRLKNQKDKGGKGDTIMQVISGIGKVIEQFNNGTTEPKTQIGITGHGQEVEHPITDTTWSKLDDATRKKLIDLQTETIGELVDFFGDNVAMITHLYALKQLLVAKEDMYNSMIKPMLEPYLKELNDELDTDS
jgi:hypothetical protein